MTPRRICVVGAGMGGVTAAWTLQQKGHRVTVFEQGRMTRFEDGRPVIPPRRDRAVGGKCFSPLINGRSYELGACSCAPGFSTILEMARDVGVPLRKRMPFQVVIPGGGCRTFQSEYWPKKATVGILREMAFYLYHAVSFKLLCDRKWGYRRIPRPYCCSFEAFCRQQRLDHVPAWMELPVVAFGYGRLADIPAWYVLDYITPVNFLGIALMLILGNVPPVRRLDTGYQSLVNRLAGRMDVRTGHRVTRIERADRVRVTVEPSGGGSPVVLDFDDLVLSVPLTELAEILDLTPEENRIRQHLYHRAYTTVACEIDGVDDRCLLLRHQVNTPGRLALIEETVEDTRGFCVCYIPEKDRHRSLEQVIEGLDQDLKAVGAALVKVDRIHQWQYFPHFRDPDMFQQFQAIQGRHNTWHVGAVARFELAERVAAHARNLLDRAFEGRLKTERFSVVKNLRDFYCRARAPRRSG